ncbi:mechanosensitive ion channel domain-containing protein [Agaribacterium haliotis]|uniref:mechanosensitive ion channel domain-containing protein n=1 Tax=Agaribacterium haliotis TaxID=2013869 RepID=UPI0013046975|nr:mechanosensitive ion channel domain-containing protein [Agaribacterium haliotis]
MQNLSLLLPQLTTADWLIHGAIFFVNIFLFIFAPFILKVLENGAELGARVRVLRSLNVLVFALHLVDLLLLKISGHYQHYFIRVGMSLVVVYTALFVYSLVCYLSVKRFGKQKELDGKTIYLDTYSSRLIDLLLLAVTVLTAVYVLIKVWQADSMLEATGIFGIFVAFLAFTSSIWAPDIIGGLIILNTQMLEDGDVVVVDGYPDEYIIGRVSLIYVILLDVRNNHRTLVRNSRFTDKKIDNLSRVASTEGVRKALSYNIGYPPITADDADQRAQQHRSFINKVDRMFKHAYDAVCQNPDIKINEKREFDWHLTSAGDYALEFTLWVYLERVPNTKVTGTIRRHLLATMYRVNEAVYEASVIEGLNLATPDLLNIDAKVLSAEPA